MFFSIIVIIGVIFVGFYAISHFLTLSNCSQVGLFFRDLEREVDKAWTEEIYSGKFQSRLPDSGFSKLGITHVCFGKISDIKSNAQTEDKNIKRVLEDFGGFSYDEANAFLYPPEKACDGENFFKVLAHAKTKNNDFFCVRISNGILNIKLEKNQTESLVRISEN